MHKYDPGTKTVNAYLTRYYLKLRILSISGSRPFVHRAGKLHFSSLLIHPAVDMMAKVFSESKMFPTGKEMDDIIEEGDLVVREPPL